MEEKNRLYVGNLPYSVDDEALRGLFSEIEGVEVTDAKVILDVRNGNRSKGFGFVTLADEAQAEKAIEAMNGKEIEGRALTVNVARKPEERSGGDRGPRSHSRY